MASPPRRHCSPTALRAAGHNVVETREPGGTPLGEAVRGIVLDSGGDMAPVAEALLFAASRAQHVAKVIRPALAGGAWVVCDRFVDSSLAYQGAARGLGIDAVWAINAPAVDGCLPDLAIVLDVRARDRGRRVTAGPKDRSRSRASRCSKRSLPATASWPRGLATASRSSPPGARSTRCMPW